MPLLPQAPPFQETFKMTQLSGKNGTESPDTKRPQTSDSSTSKTSSDPAMLAQRLGSETSWADRYVPGTPGETIMTPESSIADYNERLPESEYMTPNEAPPSYEEVTSAGSISRNPPQNQALPPAGLAQTQHRPYMPGRRYSRHETYTSITGTFTVYDGLDLSTESGSINIKLDVQPGSGPARVTLKSNSGSIVVNDKRYDVATSRHTSSARSGSGSGGPLSFLWGSRSSSAQTEAPPIPTSDDPRKQSGQHLIQSDSAPGPRPVHMTIETSSGSVNSSLLIAPASSTSIKTSAGSIQLRLVTSSSTSDPDNLASTLSTMSASSSQHIRIASGPDDATAGALISAIQAEHHLTGSGTIHADYPKEWTGLVHGSVGGSGTVNIHGNGLEYDRRGRQEMWAWRRGRDGELPGIEKAVKVRCDGSGTVAFSC